MVMLGIIFLHKENSEVNMIMQYAQPEHRSVRAMGGMHDKDLKPQINCYGLVSDKVFGVYKCNRGP